MLPITDSLNKLGQLVSLYNNDNIQITDKTSSLDKKALNEYKKFAQKSYNDILNSSTFKPNSKEEFKLKLNIEMSISSGVMTDKDFMQKQGACQDLLSSLDYDSEFNKFLESKGCSNEKELQALNKTMFKTTKDLRYVAEGRLRQTMFELDKSAAPNAMAASSALVKNVDIETLVNYVKSTKYDAANYEKGFLENYFGNEIDEKTLLIFQKEFSAYMNALNKEKEASSDKPPIEKLIIETNQADFSKYDEKYGEKYEQSLIKNYEE